MATRAQPVAMPHGPAVDDPPSRRRRGNAFYAESARAALGAGAEVHSLADVPLPFVHTALGVAVCAVAAAFRPQAAGLRSSVVASASLAAGTALTLILYDRFVYGRDLRHAVAATALPVAAIAAFAVVLAGTGDLAIRVPAGVIAALVVGGIPHLGGLRAAGREGTATRLLRDGTGVLVLAPLLFAGFDSGLAASWRAALVGGSVLLVSADALLTEELSARAAILGALVIAAAMTAVVPVLGAAGGDAVRPALLLVFWYGLRGLIAALLNRGPRHGGVLEYGFFAAAAAALVALRALHG